MALSDAPTRELGRVDTPPGTPWLADPIEHVPDLVFPLSVTTYAKMRRDSTIKSVLNAYILPILRAPWHVDPRGATDAAARVAADSLGLPVLGDDAVEGPVSTRWVTWTDHLRMALRDLVYGFQPFEPVYDVSTGTAYLSGLPERMPWSITEVTTDNRGQLAGIRQMRVSATDVLIPADRLLYYVHDREGANWYGTSLLREAFAPWLFKTDAMRGQARTLRRYGSAVPVMEPLPGFNPSSAQNVEAQRLAERFRGDSERSGATTPGYRLRLVGVEGTMPDHLPWLRYLDEQIARATLTSVLDLGNTDNGSRALGTVFLDLLVQAMQAVAEDHAATASQIARRLTDFNEGPDAEAPLVVVGDVGSSRQTLALTVANLVQAGALTMDVALEGWVREAFDLPARDPSAPPPVPPAAASVPGGAPLPGGTPVAVAAAQGSPRVAGLATQEQWPYRRALGGLEAAAGVDPVAMDAALDGLVARFVSSWTLARSSQVDGILSELAAALPDVTPLATYLPAYSTVTETLLDGMLAGWRAGVAAATGEAAAQGVDITLDPGTAPDETRYRAAAAGAAASLASSLSTGAMREALRLSGASTAPDAVVSGVATYLDGLAGALPRDVAAGLIGDGINGGRMAVMRAATTITPATDTQLAAAATTGTDALVGLSARYYASEVRDAATCTPCLEVDGVEYASLDDAEAAYPTGGYTDCRGGLRCRGMIFAVYGEGVSASSRGSVAGKQTRRKNGQFGGSDGTGADTGSGGGGGGGGGGGAAPAKDAEAVAVLESSVTGDLNPSGGEMRAVNEYVGQGYNRVNKALRAGDTSTLDDQDRANIESLKSLADQHPLPAPIVVHRGLESGAGALFGADGTGVEFTDNAFSSTSTSEVFVRRHAGHLPRFSEGDNAVLRLTLPKGHPVVPIGQVREGRTGIDQLHGQGRDTSSSNGNYEEEVLMKPGVRLRITKDSIETDPDTEYRYRVLDAEVVG